MRLEDRDPEEEITTGACAAHHGLTSEAVRLAILRGDLPAHRTGRNYRVKVRDCLAYRPMTGRQEPGRKGGVHNAKVMRDVGERPGRVSQSASGYRGVYAHGSRFRAMIVRGGPKVHLGTFDTPEEASEAYNAAAGEEKP